MGDLVTCPRYLYATFRKKNENTQTLIGFKKIKNKKKIKKVEMNSCNSFLGLAIQGQSFSLVNL